MDAATATAHLGAMMGGVALMAAQEGADFDALVAEQTRGGLNENAIRELRAAGVYDAVPSLYRTQPDETLFHTRCSTKSYMM